jgi:hypothetical protein
MRTALCLLALFGAAIVPACSCDNAGRHGGDGGSGDGGSSGALSISPADVTLDLTTGGAPPMQAFTVTFHDKGGDKDVTGQVTFTLADQTIGVMNGNVFTAGTAHGGSTTLVANLNADTAQASIHVKVHGSFSTPDCVGCTFPSMTAPTCGGADTSPTVVYPPDGVLLPPNMNIITVQFTPGTGNTQFELDFQNPATDVVINAKCTPTVDTRGTASNGCQVDLTQAMWDFIAKSNKGGDPVKVSVRGTSNGTCASPGANSVNVAFAEQDVAGGIYYWKSTVSANGTGGQIWRKSFGDAMPEEEITGSGNLGGTCNGCHFLSRDGIRMTINTDDDDSDDEYGDVQSGLVDVATRMFVTTASFGFPEGPAGFQTFNHDHTMYLATTGDGSGQAGFGTTMIQPNQFFIYDGVSGNLASPNAVTAAPAGKRCTHPDWSADDKNVVYVIPAQVGDPSWQANDSHILGGSLWSMPFDSTTKKFGVPVELVHSNGENNYYPGYSPDGAFIIFNRVPHQTSDYGATVPNNDSFSNPLARVFIMTSAPGSTPIECAALDGQGDVSNSWPRWSPFVQTYKGQKLLWVTFSSTRDYGLLVRNAGPSFVQCYPPDSAEDPNGSHGQQFPNNCRQPQIWMAAINLTTAEVMNTTDPSFPAFWLPFQDIKTHNHTAQWTSTVVTMPPPDGGACIDQGQDCTAAPNNCCGTYVCTASGTCGIL